jgi:membrane protein
MTKFQRIIISAGPINYLIEKSKVWELPGFQGLCLYDVVAFFGTRIKEVGLSERAAAISFNLLMAIPAATIFLCTLIPYMPVSKLITRELLLLTRDITPNLNTYLLVKDFLVDFLDTPREGLLSLGFLLVMFTSSNAMIGVMRSFNRSLMHSTRRNFFQKRWVALKLTLILMFLIIATVLLLVTQGAALKWILKAMHMHRTDAWTMFLIKFIRFIIIVALFFYGISFMYKYAPAVKNKHKLNTPGSILATFLTVLLTLAFSYWVNKFGNYNKIYGSIGTIIILMVLIFLNSLVLLIGYELNVSIQSLKIIASNRKHEHEQELVTTKK